MQRPVLKLHSPKRFLPIVIPLLLLACGLFQRAAQAPAPSETNAVTPEKEATPTSEKIPESPVPTQEAMPTAVLPEETLAPNPLLNFPGMIEMENLMPASGVGVRPLLEWQEVEGAVHYDVVIFEPDGRPYWAWRTQDTSVYVAGIDAPLPEDKEGPIIADGMTWQVTAFNEDQVPIAVGGPWWIAP